MAHRRTRVARPGVPLARLGFGTREVATQESLPEPGGRRHNRAARPNTYQIGQSRPPAGRCGQIRDGRSESVFSSIQLTAQQHTIPAYPSITGPNHCRPCWTPVAQRLEHLHRPVQISPCDVVARSAANVANSSSSRRSVPASCRQRSKSAAAGTRGMAPVAPARQAALQSQCYLPAIAIGAGGDLVELCEGTGQSRRAPRRGRREAARLSTRSDMRMPPCRTARRARSGRRPGPSPARRHRLKRVGRPWRCRLTPHASVAPTRRRPLAAAHGGTASLGSRCSSTSASSSSSMTRRARLSPISHHRAQQAAIDMATDDGGGLHDRHDVRRSPAAGRTTGRRAPRALRSSVIPPTTCSM